MASRAVICALAALTLGLLAFAQYERKPKPDPGPRALGLLELAPNGKAHLIPIAIMYNGDFYDASAYKADPIPMALDSGTVYQAERSGVSQGLFTVAGALESKGTFIGTGQWQTMAEVKTAAAAAKKHAEIPSVPRGMDQDSGPPRLVRPNSDKSAPANPAPKEPAKTPAPTPAPVKTAPPAASPSTTNASADAMPGEGSDEYDPNRPRLRRETAPIKAEQEEAAPTVKAAVSAEMPVLATKSDIQLIPAISDAGGPEPQSYIYTLKPQDEQQFRDKMLKMAAGAVQAYVKKWTAGPTALPAVNAPRRHAVRRTAVKLPQPNFQNVQLRVFDPSASNAPVLVLSATAQMPPSAVEEKNGLGPVFSVTLVAREDIYGELHQIKANITDPQHLDVEPRMDLIDVVDADGNGQGDLLFRETSDQGSGFAIYRIIGDNLYNLFQSTPGEQ
jgi:hypothetical protein